MADASVEVVPREKAPAARAAAVAVPTAEALRRAAPVRRRRWGAGEEAPANVGQPLHGRA